MENFNNKKIAILGFGVEGQSVTDFLLSIECTISVLDEKKRADFDEITIKQYEDKGITFQFGKIENFDGFDLIFRSPGFHPELKILQDAREKGIEITTPTKLFFDLCPCPIVGVTGTKGKGTSSTLIFEMLQKEGMDAYLGGNIGIPPLSFLEKLTPDSQVVLELSSFQLADLHKSPHIAVILMTTQEHLAPDKAEGSYQNFHADIYEYVDAKRNIIRYQAASDFAILNRDYPASNESDIHTEAKIYKVSREQDVEQGCFIRDGAIILKMHGDEEEILSIKDIALPGRHNLENVCAATVAALCAGATMNSILPVLKSFKGLEHRIENVATVRGVRYFDDSFSTTPETAIAAIEAFEDPKILILGGASKNSDFTELGKVISEAKNIKAIIGIGLEWQKIKDKIYKTPLLIEDCKDMEEVIKKTAEIGEIGDVVLLSPACSSFDMFKNYKHRGEEFKKQVGLLSRN